MPEKILVLKTNRRFKRPWHITCANRATGLKLPLMAGQRLKLPLCQKHHCYCDQKAARVSDKTAMMMLSEDGTRSGTVIEFDDTKIIFTRPSDHKTEDYVTGKFG